MASGPLTSWQIDGKTMEIVKDFIWGGSQTTADGDCSHEIKRHLLLGRTAVANLDRVLKSTYTLCRQMSTYIDKATVFPLVMYECEC